MKKERYILNPYWEISFFTQFYIDMHMHRRTNTCITTIVRSGHSMKGCTLWQQGAILEVRSLVQRHVSGAQNVNSCQFQYVRHKADSMKMEWVFQCYLVPWWFSAAGYLGLMLHVGRHFISLSDSKWRRTLTGEGGEQRDQHGYPLLFILCQKLCSDLSRPPLCHHAAPGELR